mmetsp:Transcript_47783/g.125137  ORF Transcript_47783/g.125137 Transcript_47783/m.125137 type:complete len:281 (+) Transcript_47783:1218-2060(+)
MPSPELMPLVDLRESEASSPRRASSTTCSREGAPWVAEAACSPGAGDRPWAGDIVWGVELGVDSGESRRASAAASEPGEYRWKMFAGLELSGSPQPVSCTSKRSRMPPPPSPELPADRVVSPTEEVADSFRTRSVMRPPAGVAAAALRSKWASARIRTAPSSCTRAGTPRASSNDTRTRGLARRLASSQAARQRGRSSTAVLTVWSAAPWSKRTTSDASLMRAATLAIWCVDPSRSVFISSTTCRAAPASAVGSFDVSVSRWLASTASDACTMWHGVLTR